MRMRIALGALGLVLVLAGTAAAQFNLFGSSGAKTTSATETKAKTKVPDLPIATPQKRSLPGRLADIFSGSAGRLSNARFHPPTAFPKRSEVPGGAKYLEAFGYQRLR